MTPLSREQRQRWQPSAESSNKQKQALNLRWAVTWLPLLEEPMEAFASSSAVPQSRQEFHLACGTQAEPLSLTVSETSPTTPAAVLHKVRRKHTINFPSAGVTFYCTPVSGPASWWRPAVPPPWTRWMFASGNRNTAMMEILLPRFNLPEYGLCRVYLYGD